MISRRAWGVIAVFVIVAAGIAFLGIAKSPVLAASPAKTTGGITISPAFQSIDISPNTAAHVHEFMVSNNTSEPYEFSLSAVDFGSLDESGGILFSGQSKRLLNYKYGLSQWVTLERDRVVVEPKSTVKVPVTIENKESLSPGGHYGAILVSPTGAGERPTKVEINQVLSSLLFVKKQGGEIYRLGLVDYAAKTNVASLPSAVDLRFQNAGNVHVVPRGIITIHDPAGRLVKRGIVNQNSAIMLPETFRKLSVPLDTVGTAWLPGKYRLSIAYRFDGREAEEFREVTFYYVNGWYVLGLALFIALGVLMAISRRLRRMAGRVFGWPVRRFTGRYKKG